MKSPIAREFARLEWVAAHCRSASRHRVPLGIGDDAAILRPPRGRDLVLTTDAQIEGTHFAPGWLGPEAIGRRAVESAVSDLAAMAARPLALLVTLSIEAERDDDCFRDLFRGLEEGAQHHGAPIIGGNTSRGPLAVSMTAIGEIAPGEALRRDGLQSGQELFVTGTPGLARLGLEALRDPAWRDALAPGPGASVEAAERAFRSPRARVAEAITLARVWRARAAIDLSDGLASDLRRLLESSGRARGEASESLGVEIDAIALRSLEPLADLCRRSSQDAALVALAGGEDYELLVALDAGTVTPPRIASWERRGLAPITRIGRVVPRPGLHLVEPDGTRREIPEEGFEHF